MLEVWQQWVQQIAKDETMDLDRLIRHLQVHVGQHMPNTDANPMRWIQWLAGTYNLLGILSAMTGVEPSYELGVQRLFNKWRQHPFDHTPPPKGSMRQVRG